MAATEAIAGDVVVARYHEYSLAGNPSRFSETLNEFVCNLKRRRLLSALDDVPGQEHEIRGSHGLSRSPGILAEFGDVLDQSCPADLLILRYALVFNSTSVYVKIRYVQPA